MITAMELARIQGVGVRIIGRSVLPSEGMLTLERIGKLYTKDSEDYDADLGVPLGNWYVALPGPIRNARKIRAIRAKLPD